MTAGLTLSTRSAKPAASGDGDDVAATALALSPSVDAPCSHARVAKEAAKKSATRGALAVRILSTMIFSPKMPSDGALGRRIPSRVRKARRAPHQPSVLK